MHFGLIHFNFPIFNLALLESLDILQEKLAIKIPEDKMGLALQQIQEIYNKGMEFAKAAQTPTKITVVNPKEEEKKIEEQEKAKQKSVGLMFTQR